MHSTRGYIGHVLREKEREREFLSGSMFYFSEQGIQESDVL